jgi:hypothetical protein
MNRNKPIRICGIALALVGAFMAGRWTSPHPRPADQVLAGIDLLARDHDPAPRHSSHGETNAKNVSSGMEKALREGRLRLRDAPDYSLIDDDFMVNSYALEMAGLDEDSRAAVQELIDRAWHTLGQSAARNLTMIESESAPEEGKFVYRVKPFPREGEAAIEELEMSLRSRFGDHAGGILFAALNHQRYFGAAGTFEMRITSEPREWRATDGRISRNFGTATIDPKSGRVIRRTHSADPDSLRQFLGHNYEDLIHLD